MPAKATSRRVLVPLDGSDLAEAILPLLEIGEHAWGSEALLVRSLTGDSAGQPSAEREAGLYLAARARGLERAGLRVRCEVWYGEPSQMILNAADRGQVGLIAMATHGWRGLDRLRFGSVAESVVRKAPVPVLLIRGHLRWPADRPPRILVPLDGSERSAGILAVVAPLRQRLGAVVELLQVLESGPPAFHPDVPMTLAAWGQRARRLRSISSAPPRAWHPTALRSTGPSSKAPRRRRSHGGPWTAAPIWWPWPPMAEPASPGSWWAAWPSRCCARRTFRSSCGKRPYPEPRRAAADGPRRSLVTTDTPRRRADERQPAPRGEAMRIGRRAMLWGALTTGLAGPRGASAAAGARPGVTVHRSPT
jgi:nucleotide-binding universal stress UspA family protein